MLSAECLVYLPVKAVAVLHLVNHDVVHLPLPFFAHLAEVVEDVDGKKDKVVKVQ